jgi:hypothetical protein
MQAFHNDPAIKAKFIARVEAHRVADELVQGYGYWQGGKGCALGCTIESKEPRAQYPIQLGIPVEIAALEDRIFEGLDAERSRAWPGEVLEAIAVGADLSLVWSRFAVCLLSDPEHGTARLCDGRGKAATAAVVALFERRIAGDEPTCQEWQSAAAAYAAAAAAATAAAYDAAYAAAYAADADAYAAANAAADAAAHASAYAADSAAAWAAARNGHCAWMADTLLTLLREAR